MGYRPALLVLAVFLAFAPSASSRQVPAAREPLSQALWRDTQPIYADIDGTPPSPTALGYTSYLLRTGSEGTFEELLGAVLPCCWIYEEVGKTLKERSSPNPLYRRWIDAYASREYENSVRELIAALDQAAADLPESRKAAILQRFDAASRYEWMFWDSAWREEKWPVP